MSKDTKQIAAFTLLPMVENPTALRVMALSAKMFEQMDWMDGAAGYHKEPDWSDVEIIGTVQSCVVVRRKSNGHLERVRGLAFLEYVISKQEKRDVDAANAEFKKLPQLFTT